MIVLASRSPQRSLLLARAGLAFRLVDTIDDPDDSAEGHPQAIALERARSKAHGAQLADLDPAPDWSAGAVVLAADTVVSFGRTLFGKPRDDQDAIAMLRQLVGTTHVVTTAQCCWVPARGSHQPEIEASAVSIAKVTMRPASHEEISDYVRSGESSGRSGGYAIQETGDRFVIDRQGDFDTVVGLHVSTVRRLIGEVHDALGLNGLSRGGAAL